MVFGPNDGSITNYNKRLLSIDGEICKLLNQRKEISKKDLSFPPDEIISSLANEYGFRKEYLESLFTTIEMEDSFKLDIIPTGFREYLPVLKFHEKEGVMYAVTFIRQYANASIVYLDMDWDEKKDVLEANDNPDFLELSIDDTYFCRPEGGGGTAGHMSYHYIVSPALPDDLIGIELVFKEPHWPFTKKATDFELKIKLG